MFSLFEAENLVLTLIVLSVSLSVVLFIFLNKKDKDKRMSHDYLHHLNRKLRNLEEKVVNQNNLLKEIDLDKEKEMLINILSERIKNESSQRILEELMASNMQRNYSEIIFRNFEETIYSLQRNIARYNLKSNSNLMLSLMFALFGMITILYFISPDSFNIKIETNNVLIAKGSNNDDLISFVKEYLPKISIIIIIETFAYFFLKLYKSGLDYIKYLTNELTSVQHRFLGVQLCLYISDKNDYKDADLIKECVSHLIKFEKNKSEKSIKDFEGEISIEILSKLLSRMNTDNNKSQIS